MSIPANIGALLARDITVWLPMIGIVNELVIVGPCMPYLATMITLCFFIPTSPSSSVESNNHLLRLAVVKEGSLMFLVHYQSVYLVYYGEPIRNKDLG